MSDENVKLWRAKEAWPRLGAIIIPMEPIRAGRRLLKAADPEQVALRLAAALRAQNLTSNDLIQTFGFQSSQVSQWLKGENRPDLSNALLMLPYLDIDLHFLFLGELGGLPHAKRDVLLAAMEELQAAMRDTKAPTMGRLLRKLRSA
jgi:transcriptional regulator with XRE-family HTH domain